MWVLLFIAILVIVFDKTGFKLTDELTKLLYVEDEENTKGKSDKKTGKKTTNKDKKKTKDKTTPVVNEEETTEEPPNEQSKAKPSKIVNPLERNGIRETKESMKDATNLADRIYKEGVR